MYVRLTYYMSRDSIIPQRVERLNAQSGCDGVHRVLLLNDQNRKVTATRRDDEWKSCTGHSVLWCPSPFVRSTTSQSQRTNERVEHVYSTKHSTPTTSGPWIHKELSSLVYIFIYLNFPHLTTFYFPLTCPPNNRRFVGPFQIAPVSLIRLDHPSIHYALLVLSISVCRTTHIFVFGMRESRKYVRSVASVVLKQPDMQIRTHFISSTVHRTTNKRIFGYLLCVCMYMWELISHYDFVLSDRSIAKQPSPSFLTVKHAGLFAYERWW